MKLGLISDIHEDYENLSRAATVLEKSQVTELICLGDITGYSSVNYNAGNGRNAEKCIRFVQSNCTYTVAGNHDLYTVRKTPLYNAGFKYPDLWFSIQVKERKKLSGESLWYYEDEDPGEISDELKEYLASLPEFIILSLSGIKISLSHYFYPDLTGSTVFFPSRAKQLNGHFKFMKDHSADISFSGHGHYEGLFRASEKRIHLVRKGVHAVGNFPVAFSIPCIARGKQKNGICIFDTNERTIETIILS
ncbi:MAG: metallophosphoesterase [Bacteroidota bacterium]